MHSSRRSHEKNQIYNFLDIYSPQKKIFFDLQKTGRGRPVFSPARGYTAKDMIIYIVYIYR